jgi:hypothetical protein
VTTDERLDLLQAGTQAVMDAQKLELEMLGSILEELRKPPSREVYMALERIFLAIETLTKAIENLPNALLEQSARW